MPKSRVLDVVTKDYVSDGAGGVQTTTTLRTSVYIALMLHLGAWWALADGGSTLHLFKQQVASSENIRAAEESAKRALKPFLDDRRADRLTISHDVDAAGRVILRISLRDLQAGADVSIDLRPLRSS